MNTTTKIVGDCKGQVKVLLPYSSCPPPPNSRGVRRLEAAGRGEKGRIMQKENRTPLFQKEPGAISPVQDEWKGIVFDVKLIFDLAWTLIYTIESQ